MASQLSTNLHQGASSALPARPNLPDEPAIPHNGFATFEEGEKAFMYLLRKAGVDATWTWDQTMRAIITDPLYKALNSLAEKKSSWQKARPLMFLPELTLTCSRQYTEGLKAKEQEEREARLAKIRPAIRNMLKGNPNVFHYSTFPTADRLFAQHPIWQQARIESERKLIFEEYVSELKQREVVCVMLFF
jgi:pre-mRNA-processing factor 40